MRRLSQLLGAAAVVVVALAPSAASADQASVASSHAEVRSDGTATPTPSPVPTPTELSVPRSEGGSGVQDALVILGFSVIAMAGFILIIRAGLRSASSEDTD